MSLADGQVEDWRLSEPPSQRIENWLSHQAKINVEDNECNEFENEDLHNGKRTDNSCGACTVSGA